MVAHRRPIREEPGSMKAMRSKIALLSLLSLPAMLLVAVGGTAVAAPHSVGTRTNTVTTSSLGSFKPTFAGPAATGCAVNCNLLSGPVNTPSTAAAALSKHPAVAGRTGEKDAYHMMPLPDLRQLHL